MTFFEICATNKEDFQIIQNLYNIVLCPRGGFNEACMQICLILKNARGFAFCNPSSTSGVGGAGGASSDIWN